MSFQMVIAMSESNESSHSILQIHLFAYKALRSEVKVFESELELYWSCERVHFGWDSSGASAYVGFSKTLRGLYGLILY